MRVYGRYPNIPDQPKGPWFEIDTDDAGYNDAVYVTALCQCLLLQLGESPFFADWGIPAIQSLQSQIAPDYFVEVMQSRFAPFFASLIITRQHVPVNKLGRPNPTYSVKILTHRGAKIELKVPF